MKIHEKLRLVFLQTVTGSFFMFINIYSFHMPKYCFTGSACSVTCDNSIVTRLLISLVYCGLISSYSPLTISETSLRGFLNNRDSSVSYCLTVLIYARIMQDHIKRPVQWQM